MFQKLPIPVLKVFKQSVTSILGTKVLYYGKTKSRFFSEEIRKVIWPASPTIEKASVLIKPMIKNPENIGILALQHTLGTTGSLFNALIKIGFVPQHIVLLSKIYSYSPEVVKKLSLEGIWCQPCSSLSNIDTYEQAHRQDAMQAICNFKKLLQEKNLKSAIILCDGASFLKSISREKLNRYLGRDVKIVGIEQTTYGIQQLKKINFDFPIINIAQCAAKTLLESSLVAEAIVLKLIALGYLNDKEKLVIGVAGASGAIGSEVTKQLVDRGFAVNVYDPGNFNFFAGKVNKVENIKKLIQHSNLILGCTYADVMQGISFDEICSLIVNKKIFINAASNDAPFKSLVHEIAKRYPPSKDSIDVFQEHAYPTEHGTILIRPFPINFDGSDISVPHHKISLTRGLLALAVGQGCLLLEDNNYLQFCQKKMIKLSPHGQQRIIQAWLEENSEQVKSQVNIQHLTPEMIVKKSPGCEYLHPQLSAKALQCNETNQALRLNDFKKA